MCVDLAGLEASCHFLVMVWYQLLLVISPRYPHYFTMSIITKPVMQEHDIVYYHNVTNFNLL